MGSMHEELFSTLNEMNMVDIDEEVKNLMRTMRDRANKIKHSDPKVIDAIHVIRLALS
jgi:spermidine synthase